MRWRRSGRRVRPLQLAHSEVGEDTNFELLRIAAELAAVKVTLVCGDEESLGIGTG